MIHEDMAGKYNKRGPNKKHGSDQIRVGVEVESTAGVALGRLLYRIIKVGFLDFSCCGLNAQNSINLS